jgi:homospermidine synthase
MVESRHMANHEKHAAFPGKMVILGFGSIGQGVLAVLLRHIEIDASRITIIARDADGLDLAQKHRVAHVVQALTRKNYESFLDQHLGEGDFLLNVSVEVESLALMKYCRKRRILYIDTVTEPWPGRSEDPSLTPSRRSNYALREEVLAFGRQKQGGPTAVITMGANPGLVSAWLKEALIRMAADRKLEIDKPAARHEWARLAKRLGVKVVHVAERDTQVAKIRKRWGEFVNTWSVNGFIGEGLQPAELGWGSHERHFPRDGVRHGFGCDAAILLDRPGAATLVRSWTPLEGPYHGFLITHAESISIADYLTIRESTGELVYRPTVHYAYHPCDDTVLSLHEAAGNNWRTPESERVIGEDEILEGMDELGVLLMGAKKGAYWYGSRLAIEEVRKLAPHNSATSLQVVAGILAGMVWAIRNPNAGVVEPDDLDHETVLQIASPYLGQRTWTFMIYLNDVEGGGETEFPEIGVKLTPKRGRAVAWNNLRASGEGNELTRHQSLPVTAGTKTIITKWFRTPLRKAPEFASGKIGWKQDY